MKKSFFVGMIIVIGIFGTTYFAVNYSTSQFIDSKSLNPSSIGYVDSAQKIIEDCKDDIHCVVENLQKVSVSENQDSVLTTFGDVVLLYEQNYPCHENAHHLGMWLYAYLGDIEQGIQVAEMRCGGAIIHGVVQNYLITERLSNQNPNEIDYEGVCTEDKNNPYSIERWQCLHGLGHGLASFYNHDIFEAIKICEKFDPGWEQISCSKGIFMQNVVYYLETNGGGMFNQDDMFFPCNQVKPKWAPSCYQYQITYILKQNNWNLKDSYADCDRIVPEEFVKYCYHGMGRQLERNMKGDIQNAIFFCTAGQKSSYHSECLRGMVKTVVNLNTDPEQGFIFCKLLPNEFKEDCYDAMGRWVIMLHPTEQGRKSECQNSENSDYYEICMNSSLESIRLL